MVKTDVGAIILGVLCGAIITEFTENRTSFLESMPAAWAIVVVVLIGAFLYQRMGGIMHPLTRASPEFVFGLNLWLQLRG